MHTQRMLSSRKSGARLDRPLERSSFPKYPATHKTHGRSLSGILGIPSWESWFKNSTWPKPVGFHHSPAPMQTLKTGLSSQEIVEEKPKLRINPGSQIMLELSHNTLVGNPKFLLAKLVAFILLLQNLRISASHPTPPSQALCSGSPFRSRELPCGSTH